MEAVSNNYRLQTRNGTWYYRRRLSAADALIYGKADLKFSLKTKDKSEAKKLRDIEDVRINELLAGHHLSDAHDNSMQVAADWSFEKLEQEVQSHFDKRLLRDLASFRKGGFDSKVAARDAHFELEQNLQFLSDPEHPVFDEMLSFHIEQFERDVLRGAALSLQSREGFAGLILEKLIYYHRKLLQIYDGNFALQNSKMSLKPPSQHLTFRDIAVEYLNEIIEKSQVTQISPRWIKRQSVCVDFVVEVIGEAVPISQIGYDECKRVRSVLSKVPIHRKKRFEGKSIEEAVQLFDPQRDNKMSAETQRGYLRVLSGILDLATKKGLLNANSAKGLQPIAISMNANERRLPFTLSQISEFFAASFYQTAADIQVDQGFRDVEPSWQFWLPLICLFMGMRPNEICQLEPKDIQQTPKGTWFIDINAQWSPAESGGQMTKSLKTASSRRRVPIHPEILKLGFLEFVENARKSKSVIIFSDLKLNTYQNLAAYPLKRFNEVFLRKDMHLKPRQSFYSFRHSFRDALRRFEASADVLQSLGGWSQGHLVSDDYGDKHDPDTNFKWIKQVAYEGLDLSFLYCDAVAKND